MNQSTLSVRVGILLGLVASGCATAPNEPAEEVVEEGAALSASVCPGGVPTALAPAADQTIKASVTGVGVQIYICNATATGFAWTFIAPQANLLDDCEELLGTHFIGPTWQSNDGSSVMAARAAGATVDASAIPWLLLNATSHGATSGRYSDVTSIQRLSTVGGIAPSATCDTSNLGSIVQVPYSAQYVLYKTKTRGKVAQCNGS